MFRTPGTPRPSSLGRRLACALALSAAPSLAAVPPAAAQDAVSEPPGSRLVFPAGRSASFGEVYQHGAVAHRFAFQNRSETPVRILGATAVLGSGRIEVEPERVPPGGRGEVRVELPSEGAPIPASPPAPGEPAFSPGREARAGSEGGTGATPARAEVTLTWSVREGHRAHGFLVYRSERRDGPYRRVTPETLRTRDDGEALGRYRWTDFAVEPGKTYYYLDAVTRSGQKQRLTGVLAKTVPEAAGAGEPSAAAPAAGPSAR